jgi:hypothetical protein
MASRRSDNRPYVQLLMLTKVDTGRRVGISAMWLTSFEETDGGTRFTRFDFLSDFTVSAVRRLLS